MTWDWQKDGTSLRATTPALPAVREPFADGRKTFFNQLIAAFRGWADSRNDPNRAITYRRRRRRSRPQDMTPAIAFADELTADLASGRRETSH